MNAIELLEIQHGDIDERMLWPKYQEAYQAVLDRTSTDYAPWHIVRTDDKRRGRLNCISHILDQIPYKKISRKKVELPKRSKKDKYDDQASLKGRKFVADRY